MATHLRILQLLRKIYIFSSFGEDQLDMIARRMSLVSYPRGAVVFHQNDPGDPLYLILSGSVRMVDEMKNDAHQNDSQSTMTYLNQGDVMGEMSLLTGEPRSFMAMVDSTSEMMVLKRNDFDDLLENNPSMAVHLSRLLSSRLASVRKQGSSAIPSGKIYTLLPAIPKPDQVVLIINLALSLVEQTRSKILLISIHTDQNLIAKSLGFEGNSVSEDDIKTGSLQNGDKFDKLIAVHPSGLELLCIPEKLFFTRMGDTFFPFITRLKDTYDFCLFVVPTNNHEMINTLLNESHRSLFLGLVLPFSSVTPEKILVNPPF